MGELYNLLNVQIKFSDGQSRNMDSAFGEKYFDGSRKEGYGGYMYDGRWKEVCRKVIERYGLKSGDKILDLGCAKGFFLYDFLQVCKGIKVKGIDVSKYAISKAPEDIKKYLSIGNADCLDEFPDHSFDFVSAMNTLHFLTPERTEIALKEMLRVGKKKKNYFIQVDAFTNQEEKESLLSWAPIIKTVYSVDQWLDLFKKTGYGGDYYWTIIKPKKQ